MNRLIGYITLFIVLLCVPSVEAGEMNRAAASASVQLTEVQKRKFDYFFFEGLNLKAAGKFDAAFDAFTHSLAIDSTSSPALFELSNFYLQLDRPEKAVQMLQSAVRYSPSNFTYKMALAGVSRNLGMFGEAIETLEELVKENPGKVELHFYLADALTQSGEIGKAIDSYDALELATGMNEAISMEKYRLYMQLKEKENAFREIEKLAEKYPMDARYRIRLGDLYLEDKNLELALANYRKAHEVDPDNSYYIVSMANYYEAAGDKEAAAAEIRNALVNKELDAEVKINILSRYILQLQQSQKGLEGTDSLFETLSEQHPEDVELKMMYGSLLQLQNRNDEAKFQYQLVTEMDPENAGAWQQLLGLAMKPENMDEVVRICTRCMELFPAAPEYYFYLGIAYYQQEKYEEALNTYKAGIGIIPAENAMLKSDFYGQIGDIYHQVGDKEKMYAAYDEALKHNERNIPILNNYSYFLSLDRKNLAEAERMSAITVNSEPNNSTYLDTYAWIFFVQGRYSLAKIYIERAISNDESGSAELLDHYGDILYLAGDKEKALEQWNRAKESGKEDELLDRKIANKAYYDK